MADRGICQACAAELVDPGSRHHRYPFIHCNQCGPRYSILESLPFVRANTALKGFKPCPECRAEQSDPHSRRYGLETIICPGCGPQIWLETPSKGEWKITGRGQAAVAKAQSLLAQGKLLLIQGMGTTYLAGNASDPQAVAALRRSLGVADQPQTVLYPHHQAAGEYCLLDAAAAAVLEAPSRPVLVLDKRGNPPLSRQASPFLKTLPVRLPADGLEHLLFQAWKKVRFSLGAPVTPPAALLVGSSSLLNNLVGLDLSEIASRMEGMVSGVLRHDIAQQVWIEDTVVRIHQTDLLRDKAGSQAYFGSQSFYPLRLGHGSAPLQLRLPAPLPPVLAGGSEQDNSICLAQGQEAYISPHNGELSQVANLSNFEANLDRLQALTGIQPEILAHDLDTNQLASRFILEKAQRETLPTVAVQHHHAHLAACLADNERDGDSPVIGVVFDFGGLGQDSQKGKPVIWGGEFLIGSYQDYQRLYHLAYQPLPGGDAASRTIARAALAYLWEAGIEWEIDIPSVAAVCAQETSLLRSMLKHRLNTPLHSSMGVLFEAVASLAGLRQETSYPAQALWELEAAADREERAAYSFEVLETIDGPGQIDPLPVIRALVADSRSRVKPGLIAARFHNGVAELVYQISSELRNRHGIVEVALSGEVWQNLLLLQKTTRLLQEAGFKVYTHRQTPSNNACVSLGQAVIAGTQPAGAASQAPDR